MQRWIFRAAARAGAQAGGLHVRGGMEVFLHLVLDEGCEFRIGHIDVDLGLDVLDARAVDGLHPPVELIERRCGLSHRRAAREEAMQVVADFLQRKVLLALFPEAGEARGEQVEGGRRAGVIAPRHDGGAAAGEDVVDHPELALAGSERSLCLISGRVGGPQFLFDLPGERRVSGHDGVGGEKYKKY